MVEALFIVAVFGFGLAGIVSCIFMTHDMRRYIRERGL